MTGILLAQGVALSAQPLTLDACQRQAQENYPAIRQYRLIEQSRDFTTANAAKGWLPQVSASATGAVFTDIVDMPAQMSAMTGTMKNHIASASVQVSQQLYDGGSIAAQQRVAKAQAEVQSRQLDVTMYEVRERIDQLFFGILTLDAQLRQNRLLQDDLRLSQQTVESMMRGGVANQSDIDAVSVQQVVARQQEGTLRASRHAYVQMLATFLGRELTDEVELEQPEAMMKEEWNMTSSMNRPELGYYRSQEQLLDAQRRQFDARLMPRLSAFGMGMYHTRVMNLVNNGLLAAGLSLSWNIGALYTRRGDLAKLDVQRASIESQRDVFLFNTRLQNESVSGTIRSLREQVAQDDEIIRLRERIHAATEKKVQAGTETVNELLRSVNAVSEARQAKALHEVQLLQEVYRRKHVNGNV